MTREREPKYYKKPTFPFGVAIFLLQQRSLGWDHSHSLQCSLTQFQAALKESLQASQGYLFSFPDHKEPHSPIDVEKAYVGLTVH